MLVTFQKTKNGRNAISINKKICDIIAEREYFPRTPEICAIEEYPEFYENGKALLENFGVFNAAENQIMTLAEYEKAEETGCGVLDNDGEHDTIKVEKSEKLDETELKIVAKDFPEAMTEIMTEKGFSKKAIELAKNKKDWEGLIDLKDSESFLKWHENEK